MCVCMGELEFNMCVCVSEAIDSNLNCNFSWFSFSSRYFVVSHELHCPSEMRCRTHRGISSRSTADVMCTSFFFFVFFFIYYFFLFFSFSRWLSGIFVTSDASEHETLFYYCKYYSEMKWYHILQFCIAVGVAAVAAAAAATDGCTRCHHLILRENIFLHERGTHQLTHTSKYIRIHDRELCTRHIDANMWH